jgi:hypothetical protein
MSSPSFCGPHFQCSFCVCGCRKQAGGSKQVEASRRKQLAMAGRDWVRVQEIGNRGEGSRKHGCTQYLDMTSEVAVKMAVRVSWF